MADPTVPDSQIAAKRQECDDPKCSCHQLAWMEEMERIEQEVFPDARPRGEVIVELPDGMPEDGGVGYGTF